jgi:SAM-dependent methyltransferase
LIGGGDTATPLNLCKRVALLERTAGLRDRRVLDAGCGAGEYVEEFVRRGADASGVEFNADKVAHYRQRHPDSPRVTQGDIARIAASDASFDLILLNGVRTSAPALRLLAGRLERCPGARCFGVTQTIFAKKLG